jgi:hypothetical protein
MNFNLPPLPCQKLLDFSHHQTLVKKKLFSYGIIDLINKGRNMKCTTLISLASLSLFTGIANAALNNDDHAFLDKPYSKLIHPKVSDSFLRENGKNDTAAVIANQSVVKSQMARGTCSIFSATAYIEGLMIAAGLDNQSVDLSEEWLEYVALNNKSSDGSSGYVNFFAIKKYGMANEQTYPYIGENWLQVFNPLKDSRCGNLTPAKKNICYIIHRNPDYLNSPLEQINDTEFVNAKKEALLFKSKFKIKNNDFVIYQEDQAKDLLDKGIPVVLEADFYYGSWNHREADEFGIGRNMDHWQKGIVTFPEEGSLDQVNSQKHPAGHSILVVGYDDTRVVSKTIKMADGTTKTFKYKGVYYFKNSWGTNSFGVDFAIDGVKYPGYGMMVQKYAEEYGSFFYMDI